VTSQNETSLYSNRVLVGLSRRRKLDERGTKCQSGIRLSLVSGSHWIPFRFRIRSLLCEMVSTLPHSAAAFLA